MCSIHKQVTNWMVCLWPECVVKLQFQPLWCFELHTAPYFTRVMVERGWLSQLFLVNHELLEGVEIRWDEGADGLVVVIEDLLPSSLWAHRAGWSDQAGVRGAVTLVEHRHTSESLSLIFFFHRFQTLWLFLATIFLYLIPFSKMVSFLYYY